jgi:hypothetical protein
MDIIVGSNVPNLEPEGHQKELQYCTSLQRPVGTLPTNAQYISTAHRILTHLGRNQAS